MNRGLFPAVAAIQSCNGLFSLGRVCDNMEISIRMRSAKHPLLNTFSLSEWRPHLRPPVTSRSLTPSRALDLIFGEWYELVADAVDRTKIDWT